MRDVTLETTFYTKFTSRAFATGIPTALVSGVISAYEDANVTQITAGITLTASFDSVVGLNHVEVVATAANGFENGKTYSLVITTGTVDGVSVVGEVVEQFTIGQSAAAVDLANGTDGLGALKAIVDTLATAADLLDKLGAVDEAAAAGDPSATESVMQYVKQLVNILIGTDGIAAFPAEAAPANAVSLAEVIRAIHADVTGLNGSAMRGTDSAALAAVCTEGRLAELDAANLPTDIDAIKAITDLLTAAHAEPTGVPAVNETPLDKLAYLFMALRNQITVTSTKKTFYDDGGAAEWEKDLSDDATTYTETEANAI